MMWRTAGELIGVMIGHVVRGALFGAGFTIALRVLL